MRVYSVISSLLFLLLYNCATASDAVSDYDLNVDFNKYDTYVLCVDDFFVEHPSYPNLDNEAIRRLLGDAVSVEMENTAHRTNVFNPQLHAGFRLLISEETVQFKNCDYSKDLEYWEYCTIHKATYKQEQLVVYVADFNTNKIIWQASIKYDLNKSKKKLKPYINDLVQQLFATYPKTEVAQNRVDYKGN